MRGLVFSGGGVKGAFSVGVATTLEKNYDFIAGISVGGLCAFGLAHYPTIQEGSQALLETWLKIRKPSDIVRFFKAWPPNKTWLGPFKWIWEDGIYHTEPLKGILEKIYDPERLKRSGKKLHVGYVDKTTGNYYAANENSEELVDYVLASASFPIGMTSVLKGSRVLSDGGHISMTPIRAAIEAGCTEIDIILTGPFSNVGWNQVEKIQGLWKSSIRTLDIMTNTIWQKDLKECNRINQFLKAGVVSEKFKYVEVNVYAPKEIFKIFPLDFYTDKIVEMIEEGKKCKPISLDEFVNS